MVFLCAFDCINIDTCFPCFESSKKTDNNKKKAIVNWDEYWKLFDNLCSSLNLDNKQFIVTELKDAKQHVNGLTDGWHEFLDKFEKVNNANTKNFSQEQHNLAKTLIQNLKSSLDDR